MVRKCNARSKNRIGRGVQFNNTKVEEEKMKKLVIVMVGIACASLAYGNLLSNSGFETAEGGTGGNGRTPLGWQAGNDAMSEGWALETGTNGVAFYAWNDGSWGYMLQEVTVDISSGTEFTFSINGLAEANYSSTANETYLKMEFWNAAGTTAYAVHTNDIYSAITGDPDNWNTYSITGISSNANVGMIKVVFGAGNWNNTGGSQSAKWDNADLTQIPEPVTAILLFMGIGGIYMFRRRK